MAEAGCLEARRAALTWGRTVAHLSPRPDAGTVLQQPWGVSSNGSAIGEAISLDEDS